jgi:hypothetical protein
VRKVARVLGTRPGVVADTYKGAKGFLACGPNLGARARGEGGGGLRVRAGHGWSSGMTAGTHLSVTERGGRRVRLYWAKSCAGLREKRVSRWSGGIDEGALTDFGRWAAD